MATSHSPSSSQEPSTSKRRLPPPCWSHDETVALIDAYRQKWYTLRRGNLRASHWQQVADGVAAQCPLSSPPKTSTQCRHKMEKLRKRYRSEIQRIGKGHRNHSSSWLHFNQMHSMELLSSSSSDPNQNNLLLHSKGNRNRNGVRIKIPKIAAVQPPPPPSVGNLYSGGRSLDDYPLPVTRHCGLGFRSGKDRNGGDDVMVAAIGKLGDGILKVERMKMDMVKEIESVRIKMEMKRTEMILELQQKLVDSFSTTVMEKKKCPHQNPE